MLDGDAGAETPPEQLVESYPVEPDETEEPRRRRRRQTVMPGDEVKSLNLTPMMDIMTMLLVFLVMSFANEPSNINISMALRPPTSTAAVAMTPATNITITNEMILVDDKEVVKLSALTTVAGQPMIPEVRDALLARKDHLVAFEKRGGMPFTGRLLVVAHQATPYKVMTGVLFSAGQAGFGEFKLVTMKKGD